MNKKINVLIALSLVSSVVLAESPSSSDHEASGRTTLENIQPNFTSVTPELISAVRSDFNHTRENGYAGCFQFALFGSKSTDKEDLAEYFFPDALSSLLVVETIAVEGETGFNNGKQNLLAQNFNIFTVNKDFKSTIEIAPQQSNVGLGLYWRQSFWRNHDRGRGFWLSLSTPISHVKNNMNLREQIEKDSEADTALNPNAVNSMVAAFNQPSWKYGKITQHSMSKTGLADIEFKLGYEWLQHEPAHTETYVGLIIPTGNKQNGEYVFQPIVGRGGYPGVMFGSSLGLEIWGNEAGDKKIRFELANHSEYLFNRTQRRSFDLKNKPWSRYIDVYANEEQAVEAVTSPFGTTLATPGINVLTQKVKVTPGLAHNVNSAFVFSCKTFEGEVGYNFYAKRAETIKLADGWVEGPALKHSIGRGNTNPIRDITGNPYLEQNVNTTPLGTPPASIPLIPVAVDDYATSIIKVTDLNLLSAATPALLASTIYATVGYRSNDREYPILASFGGSYLFSKNNKAVLRRWTLWGKVGLAF